MGLAHLVKASTSGYQAVLHAKIGETSSALSLHGV